MRSRYKIFDDKEIHFVTSTIVEWIPVFTSEPYFQIIIQSFKFAQTVKSLRLYAFVILDNHLHALVQGDQLGHILQSIKSYTSKEILRQLNADGKEWLINQLYYYRKRYKTDSTFQIWQEGFHPQMIQGDKMLRQKMDYIHDNPVKRGYVERPEYWRYSSARNYLLDDQSIIKIDSIWTMGTDKAELL